MIKRILLTLVLAGAVGGAVAGCNSPTTTTSPAGSAPAASAPAESAPAASESAPAASESAPAASEAPSPSAS
jgi:hypothetical protein